MAKDVRRDIANRDLGRALGRRIARLERHLREVETASQAAYRSVEDGALDFYDDDGVLRERIGKQADGSWGRVVKEGPIPPAPTEPDVVVISDGVVAITWDGRTEEKWPIAEFRMVRVHLGDTEDFTPDRDNQVGAIWAARGGTIVAVTESDDDNPVWVKLAAVSTAGHWTESDAVLVDELDEDDLEEEQEELEWEDGDGHTLTAADVAAGMFTFDLSHFPEVESLQAWWHPGGVAFAGVPQSPRAVSVHYESASVTVTDPDGKLREDDFYRVRYPYYDVDPTSILVAYRAAGWRYKLVAQGDTSDYAAAGFDDSAWSSGAAPFGSGTGTNIPAPVATTWPGDKHLWLRRTFVAATDVEIEIPVEDNAEVYVNGVLVGAVPGAGPGLDNFDPAPVVTVDDAVLDPAGNALAIKVMNEIGVPAADPTWVDIQVTGRPTA